MYWKIEEPDAAGKENDMLRVNQITCPIESDDEQIFQALCQKLKCRAGDIVSWKIAKRSVDARKKPELFYSYTLLAKCREEQKILTRNRKDRDIVRDDTVTFRFQVTGGAALDKPPVIVGTGPAGLFCALELARAGFRPILLERGRDVERRSRDVEGFWKEGKFFPESNVQFGEGGAGTFSDGKLNTLVKDKYGRNRHVLETFVKYGAKESILYDQKPHLGTDVLKNVIRNIRDEIISLGGEVRFESRMTDIRLSEKTAAQKTGRISAVEINGEEWLETDVLVLAIGHSARDTFSMLYERGLRMEAKPFAVGFRVQHPQSFIDRSQYGADHIPGLGAAAYKLTAKAGDGRGVYTFCMCPGGYVVNASSEEGRLAVNGMSYSGRDGDCANSAVIVSVSPEDYKTRDTPLDGIFFQRELEQNAYRAGNGKIPIQKYREFQKKLVDRGVLEKAFYAEAIEPFSPALMGQYEQADLTDIMPASLNRAFAEGMEEMNRKIRGFASGEVWLCGIESRTSSPIRIDRDDVLQSNIEGIYPCGEGAGYAGGITSAAMDGIKAAQQIAAQYRPVLSGREDMSVK